MRVRTLVIPFVAAVALLAGCAAKPAAPTTNGVESLEASAILDKAEQALSATSSFHVKGKGKDSTTGGDIEVDLLFKGNDKKGTIAIAGVTIELLEVGGKSYIKGDADMLSQFVPDSVDVS